MGWSWEGLLLVEGAARGGQLAPLGIGHLGETQVQAGEGVDDGGGDDQAGEPFVIRWHHVPRGIGSGGVADHVFVSHHVISPMPALGDVAGGKLPILFGIVEAFEESALLLLAGEVEEEFSDHHTVACEVALEVADVQRRLTQAEIDDSLARLGIWRARLAVFAAEGDITPLLTEASAQE